MLAKSLASAFPPADKSSCIVPFDSFSVSTAPVIASVPASATAPVITTVCVGNEADPTATTRIVLGAGLEVVDVADGLLVVLALTFDRVAARPELAHAL